MNAGLFGIPSGPDLTERVEVVPNLNVEWVSGTIFYKSITSTSNFTFTNVQEGQTIILVIRNATGGNLTFTFPAGIKWPTGIVPTTIVSACWSVFTFMRVTGITLASPVENLS